MRKWDLRASTLAKGDLEWVEEQLGEVDECAVEELRAREVETVDKEESK